MAKPSSRVGHLTTIPHPIPAVIDTQKQSISDSISLWLKARTNKDISRYLSFYDEADFRFNGGEMSQWKEKILKGFSLSEHEIFTEKKVTLTRDWQSYAEFTVELDKISKNDTVHSRVTTIWQPGKNGWKIIREKTLYQ
jgi:ketosteroid isomerase-like protein